mgnify:CR=1 FL=1
MFTPDERDFMVLYHRQTNKKPSPSLPHATIADENPYQHAEFVWSFYAGMGNTDFMDMQEGHIRGLKSLIEKGFASITDRSHYMNFTYHNIVVHLDRILALCPKGRRDVPAYVMILNGLHSENLSIFKNSRRAAFVDTLSGKRLAYRMSHAEENALKFLLGTGFLVETTEQKHTMGSKMQQVILASQSMPKELPVPN